MAIEIPCEGILDGENRPVIEAFRHYFKLRRGGHGIESESSRVDGREMSGAIVQEHGNKLVPPCRYQHDVKSTIAIYVSRQERQPSGGSRNAEPLRSALAELK